MNILADSQQDKRRLNQCEKQQNHQQQQQQRNELQVIERRRQIPLSFKGMILIELFRKYQSSLLDKDLQQHQYNQYNKRPIRQLMKRQLLMRWYFNVYRKKIIKQTINRILTQQSICRGSFFYRLKRMISQQKQQRQPQQQLKQKQQLLKLKQLQQQLQNQQLQQQQQQLQQQQIQLEQQQDQQAPQQQTIQSKEINISQIFDNHKDINKSIDIEDDYNNQTVSRILLEFQKQFNNNNKNYHNENDNQNEHNDSMIHLATINNNHNLLINQQQQPQQQIQMMMNKSEQQSQIVINIQSNLYNQNNVYNLSHKNTPIYQTKTKTILINEQQFIIPSQQQQQQTEQQIIFKNNKQTVNINTKSNNKHRESKHIQTIEYRQKQIQTSQKQININQNNNNINNNNSSVNLQSKQLKQNRIQSEQEDQTDKLIKQYQKQMLFQFTKLNKIMRHIDQLQSQYH